MRSMSTRMTSRMRAVAAVVAATGIVTVVVLAQPGASSKARADSTALLVPAAPGSPGAPGSSDCCPHTHARAQALVKPNGTAVRKTGITSTTHIAIGTYCIALDTDIPLGSTAPVVTQDVSLSQSAASMSVSVAIASSASDCPPGSNSIEVLTFADLGSQRTPADEAFTVVVA